MISVVAGIVSVAAAAIGVAAFVVSEPVAAILAVCIIVALSCVRRKA